MSICLNKSITTLVNDLYIPIRTICTSVKNIFCSFKIELPTPTKYQQHFIYNYMYVYSPYFLLEHCNKFGFFGGVQRTQIDFSSESNFQMYQFSLNLEFFQKYKSLIFFLDNFKKMYLCHKKSC